MSSSRVLPRASMDASELLSRGFLLSASCVVMRRPPDAPLERLRGVQPVLQEPERDEPVRPLLLLLAARARHRERVEPLAEIPLVPGFGQTADHRGAAAGAGARIGRAGGRSRGGRAPLDSGRADGASARACASAGGDGALSGAGTSGGDVDGAAAAAAGTFASSTRGRCAFSGSASVSAGRFAAPRGDRRVTGIELERRRASSRSTRWTLCRSRARCAFRRKTRVFRHSPRNRHGAPRDFSTQSHDVEPATRHNPSRPS